MNNKVLIIATSSLMLFSTSADYILKQKIKEEIAANFKIEESQMYAFTTHTFTNCGKTGQYGPTLEECKTTYNTTWDEEPSKYNMLVQGIQEWTVPKDGIYKFVVAGAKGGDATSYSSSYIGTSGGLGAVLEGNISLSEGDIIKIGIGQMGITDRNPGGGGGTFVVSNNGTLLFAAGGGGGGGTYGWESASQNAKLNNSGGNGYHASEPSPISRGGSNGQGGYTGDGDNRGAGGAGWLSNGINNYGSVNMQGKSWANNLLGGVYSASPTSNSGPGGFGGGGSGGEHKYPGYGGGGGGYSGGGGGSWNDPGGEGGGGGSYYNQTFVTNYIGNISNSSHGYVTITLN